MANAYVWLQAVSVATDFKLFPMPAMAPSFALSTPALGQLFQPNNSGPFMQAKFRGTVNRALSAHQDVTGNNRPGTVTIGLAGGPTIPSGAMFDFDGYCAPAGRNGPLWLRIAASSFPRTAGWTSENGFRGPDTGILNAVMAIIRQWPVWDAKADTNESIGAAAEQSVHKAVLGDRTWETDVRDGASLEPTKQLIDLLGAINTWYTAAAAPKPTEASAATAADLTAFQAKVPYWAPTNGGRDDRPLLVQHALECFFRKRETVAIPIGVTDGSANDVLAYLEFRADCRETADIVVRKAGGKCWSYGESVSKGVLPIDIRPGMYAYYSKTASGPLSHTMLVSDVFWDALGQPTKLRIAESNKGGGWGHPGGMVPWKRRIWRDRLVAVGQQDANRRMHDAAGGRFYLVVNPRTR